MFLRMKWPIGKHFNALSTAMVLAKDLYREERVLRSFVLENILEQNNFNISVWTLMRLSED